MRVAIVVAVACLSSAGLCAGQDVQASIRKSTNIPAQELVLALKTLAYERGFQLVFRSEVVGATRTHGAVGDLTTTEALTRLLEGTNLGYSYLNDKTVTIFPASSNNKLNGAAPSAGNLQRCSGLSSSKLDSVTSLHQTGSEGAPDCVERYSQENQILATRIARAEDAPVQNSDGESNLNKESTVPATLEEVIVSAQRREEPLQQVPISIVALTAEDLRKRNIASIDQLPQAVPGLSLESSGGYARRIEIRGISDVTGYWSTVGVYVDDIDATSVLASQLPLNTYDLERVEVLRGPQGTLYGEGSSGGTIRFITKKPDLSAIGFQSDILALFTQDGSPSQIIDGVINLPIIQDTFGIRVAANFEHDGGWIDQPAINRKDINSGDVTDGRLNALWKASDLLKVDFTAEVHRADHGSNTGEDANGNFTQLFELNTSPRVIDNFDLLGLAATYDLSFADFRNSLSYLHQYQDTTNYTLTIPVAPAPAPPLWDLQNPFINVINALTDELKLSSKGEGPWQWTVGSFFRNFRQSGLTTLCIDNPGPLQPGDCVSLGGSGPAVTSKSWAVFADSNFKPVGALTLGAGVRYFHDTESDLSRVVGGPSWYSSQTFTSTDPRFYLRYDVNRNLSTYASASKGFRSGGFNGYGYMNFEPESVWTYEVGAKSSWLDHRVAADVAVYYADYKNYQVDTFAYDAGLGIYGDIVTNAGNALIKGVEWDLQWRVANGLTLGLNGDALNNHFYRVNGAYPSYLVGDNIDLVPKYQIAGSVQSDFKLGSRAAFVRFDYSIQGRETYRNEYANGPPVPTPWWFSQSDVIHMLNFNGGINLSSSVNVGLFAQNLLNDRGYADPFSIQDFATRPRPRTYGIRFGYSL